MMIDDSRPVRPWPLTPDRTANILTLPSDMQERGHPDPTCSDTSMYQLLMEFLQRAPLPLPGDMTALCKKT